MLNLKVNKKGNVKEYDNKINNGCLLGNFNFRAIVCYNKRASQKKT